MMELRLRFPVTVILVGLALGLGSDLLLYGQPLGISVPLIALVVVGALLALAIYEGIGVIWSNIWLVAPLLFFAMMSAVRAAPQLRLLNIAGALFLLVLLAHALASRPLTEMNLGEYVGATAESAMLSLMIPFPLLARGREVAKQNQNGIGSSAKRVAVGLLIAAPFLIVFTILFASADLIFDSVVERLFSGLNPSNLFGHTAVTLMLAWPIMGGLAYALSRKPGSKAIFNRRLAVSANGEPDAEAPALELVSLRGWLGIVESAVVLFSVDLLFLLFVAIQFAMLFGGEAFLRVEGLTYSGYARRGFFELLAVSIITLGLILALDFVTRRESRRQRLVFMAGSGAMIGMTIIILASAFQRLQLYEWAYGFTTLRVYSHVFMIWLAILLAYFLVFLALNRSRLFATGALVMTLGVVATLDLLNPDAFIVRQNIARYERGEELDVAYLGSLSADAIPYLVPLLSHSNPEIGDEVGSWLHLHLNSLDRRRQEASWASYHVAISRAYHELNSSRSLIKSFDLPDTYWVARYD
jgi:hypothetical protein